ncbi:MAG TPA: TonB-dependent receptor, partial [Gemmatimonadales bacterium]
MIRPALLGSLGALLLAGSAWAQPGAGTAELRGQVVDAGTGRPVARAKIETALRGRGTESAGDGWFRVAVGSPDTLVVRAIGYFPTRLPVAEAGSPIRIALRPVPLRLTDIVVTTSRRPERAGESPIAVATVGEEEISAIAAPSADRVLSQIPGLQVLPGTPTGADLSIRGINGARVLVLVDGEPAAGALLENRDVSRLSTAALSRLEVVKGPLSALYGSDALGGVVNLVSRDPTGPLTVSAEARAGDAGRKEARLAAETGEGGVALRVDGAWREDRRVPSITAADGALARIWDFKATVRSRVTSALALRADVSLLRERQRWRLSSDGFNGFNDNAGKSGWAEAVFAPRRTGTWRARLYAEEYTHRFRQARDLHPLASDTAPSQRERLVKGRVAWSTTWGDHGLDAGLDLLARSIVAPGKVEGTVSDHGVEGYLQDTWSAGRVLFTPAARLSWNSRWGSALTPSLAAAMDLAPSLRLRAGAARGFRGPSFKELAWEFPNPFAGYTIRGNPDLLPERSWQWSVGAAWSITPAVIADVEAYRNDLRDLIELTQTGTDPASGLLLFSPRNVARARTQGVDA